MSTTIPTQSTSSPKPQMSPSVFPGTSTVPALIPSPDLVSGLYRLTVRQFDQMVNDGVIADDERVELIEGLLVTKMGRNRPHVQAGKRGLKTLSGITPTGWHVAKEDPLVASDLSKPEPDLAVVRGEVEDYDKRDVLAADVALVVEIAESSLIVDRTDMVSVYSASGIPVYWIINLVEGQVEVYSDPSPAGYQSRQVFQPGQDVPVVIDGNEVGKIPVADILP